MTITTNKRDSAGRATPTSEKGPDAANVGDPVQTETQSLIFDQPADDGKRIATLTARAALVGLVLRLDADGCCLVQPFGTAVPLASLQAAEAIVYGCEQVRAEIGALAARLVRPQGVQHG